MNGDSRQARRYHWLSEGLKSFVDQPHAAIEGANQGEIVNLTDRRADASRNGQLELLQDRSGRTAFCGSSPRSNVTWLQQPQPDQPMLPHLVMPAHHDVRESDVVMRRLHGNMAAAAERGRPISPSCCWCPASAPAPCGRWRWSPRSCTARLAVFPIPAASRWRMAARTGIRFRCR